MKIFVAVVAFLMSQITVVSAKTASAEQVMFGVENGDKVTYSCTDANVLTLTIGDRTSSDQDTTAYFASSLETDTECIQTLTAGATTDVTFTITLSTTDPAKCGMVFDNNTSVFTGTLWIKKALTIVQNGDSYSNLQIRCEGAARDVDATVTAITDTSSPILPSEAQSNENVAITVELADGSAISGAVTMAQQIRLRVALTMQSAPVARAVRVSDCTVKPTSSSDASVKLITDYCGDSSTGVLATSQGFTGAASADGTTQESISASFPPFLIAGHESTNSMFITCRCVFCGTAGDNKCEGDQCATNNARRRRRDVEETSSNSTVVSTSVFISLGAGRSAQGAVSVSDDQTGGYCENQTIFIAVTSVIAAVLLFALAVIVFMYTKLPRRQNPVEKEGVTNPAF